MLLIFGSSACSATYQILTRKLAGIDAPETSVTYTTIILGAVVFSAVVPGFLTRAAGPRDTRPRGQGKG